MNADLLDDETGDPIEPDWDLWRKQRVEDQLGEDM